MLPPEAAKSPTVHKIHILGEDERSKFIAHALSGVYDSVEMMGWRGRPVSRYRGILKARPGNSSNLNKVARNAALPRVQAQDDKSHIKQLIVTGQGWEAAQALQTVKHRVDENTSICVLNDGMGVLEDVRRKIFDSSVSSPDLFLGHMGHRLAYNRKYDSVKQLKSGLLKFTGEELKSTQKTETRTNFVEAMRQVKDMRASWSPYEEWLRHKLPSVLFGAAVEPICVLLNMPYEGMMQNPAALRMMHKILDEITLVLDNLPELENSTVIRDFTHGKGLQRVMYSKIIAKRQEPSLLVRQVSMGLRTDVQYLNGYFLRRARQLGVDMPMNNVIADMIKAKHSQSIERLNTYIPMEETSIPSESSFRQRTLPHKLEY